ncbi:CHASE domain-containing protein [Pseudaquabacterium pictum]|uniref:histidine kinase n=1 Tax=Pseudaquabacterium pictum TaxID=2315236 RepID=A0A480ATD4_9BURK|nr:CHASE domain-containing protein [Rubrivivax pictus]GCL61978.1 hypothetical protein AQPW35_10590 [Rubrivivax pictus]
MKRWTTWFWPALVGLLALLTTAWLTSHERELQQRDLRRNFDFGLRQAATQVEQRMASYEQMLRGVRGLFDASSEVSPQDFDRYVDLLQAGADFAGLRGIGHAPLQDPADAPRAPVALLAPAGGARITAPGSDLLARPQLRAAMLQARDAGGAVMTPLVRPDNPADGSEPGVLLFMALYTPGQPLLTAADRRQHLRGWVFAAFRLDDLVASLYGQGTPGLDLRIHDGASIDAGSRIFPASVADAPGRTPRFDAQEYIGVPGHTWTLWARSTPAFEHQPGQDPAQVIAVAGTAMGAALTLLAWLLLTGRDRAQAAAREMTRQLQDSERQYRRIVETASEGIWMVDAQGLTTFANPALLRLLGCAAGDLTGRPWADFMDADGGVALHGAGAGAAVAQHDIRFRRPDGSQLWAQVSASRIVDEAGQGAGMLAMVTDVSQRHQDEARRTLLEDQLRQSQKMEAIGTLAGGIAHDFNNILAAILGNVALVQQDLGSSHPSQPRLQQIAQAGARARSLVQQIVTFSRQQPQALVVQPLRPLLEETVKLLRATLPARVQLVLQGATEPLPVAADATQLQQVLLNLCTNAWHALPGDSGRIAVGLDSTVLDAGLAERLGGLHPGPHVHVWVQDDGTGMDEATRQRIFEPFYTTKPVGQGTGLGLAVVHGIVTSHGGAITVDSTPGRGSTFHLYFPQAQQALAAPDSSASTPLRLLGQGRHVLYVDDDPVMGLMVETLLLRQGWRVSCLDDPRAALARAQQAGDAVDVVVTDFNMPGLSGLELARTLADSRPALPVVITSGYITDGLRAEARQAGVRQLLQKEHTLDQLGPLLVQVLAEASHPGG